MSFHTRNGTRGARQPGGKVMLWLNKLMAKRVRRSGRTMGFNALVLTTVGRRSGSQRETPVGWFPGNNLAAHPDKVQIETGGQTIAVTAEELHGTERDEAWRRITATAPRFAQYQQKTDRELPIIRLKPRSD